MENSEFNEAIGEQLQPTRRKIVLTLKQNGAMTAAELADLLGITSMGIRRHLMTLERDRLVRHQLVHGGKGRPGFVYELSSSAEDLFPKNYASLVNEFLEYVADDAGDEMVVQLFERRAHRRIRNARSRLNGMELPERIAGLAEILTNEGYLAEWERLEDGSYLLSEHNCALHEVAEEYRVACSSEMLFIQAVLPDATITREHHMMAGASRCAYRIRPNAPGPGHE